MTDLVTPIMRRRLEYRAESELSRTLEMIEERVINPTLRTTLLDAEQSVTELVLICMRKDGSEDYDNTVLVIPCYQHTEDNDTVVGVISIDSTGVMVWSHAKGVNQAPVNILNHISTVYGIIDKGYLPISRKDFFNLPGEEDYPIDEEFIRNLSIESIKSGHDTLVNDMNERL